MQKKINNKLHCYKQLQKQIDAQQTKVASIQIRKTWLERQKVVKYTNEYDRIRCIISQNVVKGTSVEHWNKRADELKRLGAKAIEGIAWDRV